MSLGTFAGKNPNLRGLILLVSLIGIKEKQTSQDYVVNDLNRFLHNVTLKKMMGTLILVAETVTRLSIWRFKVKETT